MKRLIARLLAGFAALLLALAAAAPAGADPPIWRIRSGKAEVVLFGSVHLLSEGLAWRTPALDAAMAEADSVWFEIGLDADGREEAARAAARLGYLPVGQTLSAFLTPEGRELLARTAARLGLPMAQLEPLRPWYAEVMISLADLQRAGGQGALGVEEQLMARTPPAARRKAFETATEQIGILARQPSDEQVAALMRTLHELEEDPDAFRKLQAAWAAGDVGWIEREALAPMKATTPRLYRDLVAARNRRWTRQIERLLKGSEQALIVVGVGHLVGSDGVPAMLRRKGIVVEGP